MLRAGWLVLLALSASSAHGGTLDRVHAAGVLRCVAAPRPGFADAGGGLGFDLCRALTIAVLGPNGRTEFHLAASARDFDRVRDGAYDVAFVTADEVQTHHLAASLTPGPAVFIVGLAGLAHPGVTDLSGRTVCFMDGSAAHQALEAWAARTGTPLVRSGFQEAGEMQDAFDAHRCDAMAGEAAGLAAMRGDSAAPPGAHVLPPWGVMPVLAAASPADGAWASLVFWSLAATVQSERAPNPWRGDLPGADIPGLRPGWQADVLASLGSYGDMRRRALGGLSSLPVAPGLNALWPEGLLLPSGPR